MKNWLFPLLLFFVSIQATASDWSGSHFTSPLKISALENTKKNPVKAVAQYLELVKFYNLINADSVNYFSAKAIDAAINSSDTNLVVLAWSQKATANNPYLSKQLQEKAQQIVKKSSDPLLNCLSELVSQSTIVSPTILNKVDTVLLRYEKNAEKFSNSQKLVYAFLLMERGKAGYWIDQHYKFNANIELGVNFLNEQGLVFNHIRALCFKTRILNTARRINEAVKLGYTTIDMAQKTGNFVLYQSARMNLVTAAMHAQLYKVVEKECYKLISEAYAAEHKNKPYATFRLSESYSMLNLAYVEQKQYDKALEITYKWIHSTDSLAKLKSKDDSINVTSAKLNLGRVLAYKGEIKKSIEVFSEILKKITLDNDPFTYVILNTNIGVSYIKLKEYEKGIRYINKIQSLTETHLGWQDKSIIYYAKSEGFDGLNNSDSALYYLKKYVIAKDSVFNTEKQKAVIDFQEKYETEKLSAENETLFKKAELNKAKEKLYISLIIIIILIALVVIIIFRNKQHLKVKQNQVLKAEKENLASQLLAQESVQAKYLLELELKTAKEKEIQTKLDFKARETTSMATVALQNANLLIEIQKLLKGINGNQDENNRIIKEVNSLISNQKHLEAFWDTFKKYFQEIHPRFFEILEERHPKLSLNDQKICAFLQLGMSTVEISTLQNIEPRSFLRTRQRLKEKLNLESSDEIELYLSTLTNL